MYSFVWLTLLGYSCTEFKWKLLVLEKAGSVSLKVLEKSLNFWFGIHYEPCKLEGHSLEGTHINTSVNSGTFPRHARWFNLECIAVTPNYTDTESWVLLIGLIQIFDLCRWPKANVGYRCCFVASDKPQPAFDFYFVILTNFNEVPNSIMFHHGKIILAIPPSSYIYDSLLSVTKHNSVCKSWCSLRLHILRTIDKHGSHYSN